MRKKDIQNVLKVLNDVYSDAECALNFRTPYELLVATILSAQCTDVRVNMVTEKLFKEYNTPLKMVELTEVELQEKIKTCGFYRNKAKNILETSRKLLFEFNSQVPSNMDDLTKLPGVGRKTANVVMSNAYNIPAIAVDTHVFRVSKRIGLAKGDTPLKVEEELMEVVPKKMWSKAHHFIIWHGRKICKARKPECNICPISNFCDYYKDIT
ncbi:DNA-(apurinic or apyrimidinic site) lyase /endonuclease III [Clostridium acidisoli DSM 12555]|uniref:Endonuclease III n=1 Tax=Clostridium acidisoli DSM 12555 TaxID=1121291 RepID=A0A1W1XJ77_9CLOT|nr:endonuclease III [Clostridium acidisoli]SMC23824.1 DNA-(apurinic or apyrimidinic site) lyase /endonuclease III [Clostridium acidisoli DSM 12555]